MYCVRSSTSGSFSRSHASRLTGCDGRISWKVFSRHVLIDTILHHIHENYQNTITLNDISQKVYRPLAYCSSLITSETGKNFVDILNEIRIQKAIELLKDPKRKISEIAYAVGFRKTLCILCSMYRVVRFPDFSEPLHLKGEAASCL